MLDNCKKRWSRVLYQYVLMFILISFLTKISIYAEGKLYSTSTSKIPKTVMLDEKYSTEKSLQPKNATFMTQLNLELNNKEVGNDSIANVSTNSNHFPEVHFPFGNTGRLLFPAIITAYLLLCLTIVCDCFLIPCIQAISTSMDLSLDVAGATLMAAASSSPEFFINLLATFLTNSDVGVGTVLGTGLYALHVVPALCILFASSKALKLDYWPVTRDSLAYLVSIVLLVVTLRDGRIYWYEATMFIVAYFLYLIVLHFNNELRYRLEMLVVAIQRRRYANRLDDPSWRPLLHKPVRPAISMSVEDVFYVLEDHTPEFYTMGDWPSDCGLITKIQWVLMWPIITILRLTVPTFNSSKFYVITFLMCVAWIGVISYGIAWMIITIGDELSMPESVMGLTIIAFGMSIPETISGVIVSNQGYGTMAMCNALGSNTFAILMCLGLPWIIKTLFFTKRVSDSHPYLLINSQGLEYTAWIVLIALIVVYTMFSFNKFRLKSKTGWMCVVLYLIFVGISIYIELQFFWKAHNR